MMKLAWAVEPPLIELSKSFVLTGPRVEDAMAHRRFALDPDAACAFGWTVDEARAAPDAHYEEVVDSFIRGWERGSRLSLTIRRRSDFEPVGAVELKRLVGGEADASYLVESEYRRQGLASLALAAFLAWAARELAIRRVHILCAASNKPSQRVAEKCGFLLVGRDGHELRYRLDIEAEPAS